MSPDELWMSRALELAEKGRYSVSPNPMVGCLIVRGGEVLGEGFHRRAGEPHAEALALATAQEAAGATVYVTLEPCAHEGRTPACADALVAAGVAKVVVATIDPSPHTNGGGIERLLDAGIEVSVGVLEDEARRLNESFLFSVRHGRPFVVVKAGMTLDGKLATASRQSQWITSEEARNRSLLLREEYDAILVGSGTIKSDDPKLSRRSGLNESIIPWTRVVVDADGDIPLESQILTDEQPTLLFTVDPVVYASATMTEAVYAATAEGKIDLERVLRDLAEREIRSVIVEGGSLVISDILKRGLWQKLILFVAPMMVGGAESPSIFNDSSIDELTEALRFRFDRIEKVGPDVMLVAYPTRD